MALLDVVGWWLWWLRLWWLRLWRQPCNTLTIKPRQANDNVCCQPPVCTSTIAPDLLHTNHCTRHLPHPPCHIRTATPVQSSPTIPVTPVHPANTTIEANQDTAAAQNHDWVVPMLLHLIRFNWCVVADLMSGTATGVSS